METIHAALSRAASNLHDCLDAWSQIEAGLTRMEQDLKHWPQAASLKKSLEKK
jgi:hypothetical protein